MGEMGWVVICSALPEFRSFRKRYFIIKIREAEEKEERKKRKSASLSGSGGGAMRKRGEGAWLCAGISSTKIWAYCCFS
jgi:hypothetical protein